MGSSLSDLGGVIQGSSALNPLFASVILPFVLIALLLGHPQAKWLAVGVSLAMAVTLGISAVIHPTLIWLGSGTIRSGIFGRKCAFMSRFRLFSPKKCYFLPIRLNRGYNGTTKVIYRSKPLWFWYLPLVLP
jgi:hypothetical protein